MLNTLYQLVSSVLHSFAKKYNLHDPKPVFTALLCLAFLLICELTIFNLSHYATIWANKEFTFQNTRITLNDNDSASDDQLHAPLQKDVGIKFNDLNTPVASVYIDLNFDENRLVQRFYIQYGDEDNMQRRTPEFDVVKNVPETHYVVLHCMGDVSYLRLVPCQDAGSTSLRDVIVNKPIPISVNVWRMFLLFVLLYGIWYIRYRQLLHTPVDFTSKTQQTINSILVIFTFVFLFFTIITSEPLPKDLRESQGFYRDQYNADLVDAFLKGHVYLDAQPSESLLREKRPYDYASRYQNGVSFQWDTVFYKGKYYSYYGIVPVLTLFLPFKALTGAYFPPYFAVFLFCLIAMLALLKVWKHLTQRFMRNMPYIMYALGSLTISMSTMILYIARRPRFYEVAVASGICFATLGLWQILKATTSDKILYKPLALGSLCLALAVGCKANLVFISFLVPIFLYPWLNPLWQEKQKFYLAFACVAVPYTVIACLLMWYNYARFGSIFEFGISYQLTTANMKTYKLLNPVSKLTKALTGIWMYVFQPINAKPSFPFVDKNGNFFAYMGYVFQEGTFSLMAFPIGYALFGTLFVSKDVQKESKTLWSGILGMIIIGLVMAAITTLAAGIYPRYEVDFLWLFILAALLVSFFIYLKSQPYKEVQTVVLVFICTAMFISVFVSLLISFFGEENRLYTMYPITYYHIKGIFGVWH